MSSLMSGFQKGMYSSVKSLDILANLTSLTVFYDLSHARIENHAEHGGTLNEHQLNRLVSFL